MPSRRELPTLWRPLPLLALWITCGVVLSHFAGEVRDWYDMTDEMRYERLAISIARTHSLVPRIHGVDVQSFSQLYPLLIAPLFAGGLVPHDVVSAHVLNAWLMSSTCVPVYLLARRVIGSRGWALFVAFCSVSVPWILYTTMLMTEVAAYPAFAWTLYGLHRATVRPSWRGDVLALLGLALAFFARTELLVLVVVAPIAIVIYEAGRASGRALWSRLAAGTRTAVRGHRVLAAAYVVLVLAAIAAELTGRLSAVVGIYGNYAQTTSLLPPGLLGSFAAHVAVLALGIGILPFLVGAAWMLATALGSNEDRERHAFACVASVAMLAVLFQATNFDVRYTGFVHDRFLAYLVPPVLIAMVCAVVGTRRPRWSLALVALVTVIGFATGSFPAFTWQQFAQLTPDSPVSGLIRRLVALTHSLGAMRVALVVATVLLAAIFLLGAWRLGRRPLALGLATFTLAALVTTTALTFAQFFDNPGESSRPVTTSEAGQSWIDQTRGVGLDGRVTIIPAPVSSNWFVSQQAWRDVEFWNASVVRDALEASDDQGAAFAYSGIWFPKLELTFDPATGLANLSPTPYVAASDKDTRFAIEGTPIAFEGVGDNVELVRADEPWRAAWISFGMYDDGWTKPGVTARIRIFPYPGQRQARIRLFAFAVRASRPTQPVKIVSDVARWDRDVTEATTVTDAIYVCVPPHGFTEVRISTPDSATIPGDVASLAQSTEARRGGVFFGETALSTKVGAVCRV